MFLNRKSHSGGFFALKCATFMLPLLYIGDRPVQIQCDKRFIYEYATAFFYYDQFAQATVKAAISE
ncbi:hypothetical protein Psyaliredsea_07870 [Psychrobacter alimentarius]